jgi:predicted N-acetyltransferase YhbS
MKNMSVGILPSVQHKSALRAYPQIYLKKLPRYPVPAFRVGRLAIDTKYQGVGIGYKLLKHALLKAVEVSEKVGLYAVLVDAIKDFNHFIRS